MSHFTTVQTKINSLPSLRKALDRLGWKDWDRDRIYEGNSHQKLRDRDPPQGVAERRGNAPSHPMASGPPRIWWAN